MVIYERYNDDKIIIILLPISAVQTVWGRVVLIERNSLNRQ